MAALLLARPTLAGQDPLPAGVYRLEMRVAAHTAIPLFGESDTATVSLSRVEIERDGAGWRQTHRVCATRFDGGVPFVRVVMPPRFIASLAEHSYTVDLDYAPQGWRYRADLGLETVGVRRSDADGPLPTTADDPSVLDSDGDGHPGATLLLSIAGLADGELYVVQRGHSLLDGWVTALGQAQGHIELRRFEQRVVAAVPGFLARNPRVAFDASRSTFRLTRVADATTCDALETASYDPGPLAAAIAGAALPRE